MSRNELIDILGDDDFHISDTPILFSQSPEIYLKNGVVEEGNSISEMSVSETTKLGNKQVSIPVPGYATIMKKLHSNDAHSGGTIADHDFDKTAFLYEKKGLEEKEITSSQINKGKNPDTIVSSKCFDSFEQYKYLADKILNAPDKEYCVYAIEKDAEEHTEPSIVIFLGVYQLDKISSLYNRKIILLKTKKTFNF